MRIAVFLALGVLPLLASADPGTVTVAGLQDGRPLLLSPEAQEMVARLAVDLLRTASYEAGPTIATEERWQAARQGPHLHVRFDPPRAATLRSSTTGPAVEHRVQVAALLMSIAGDRWPDYLLVRERGTVRAFAKYHATQAQALRDAMEAGAREK
jgi:hypothetical protein